MNSAFVALSFVFAVAPTSAQELQEVEGAEVVAAVGTTEITLQEVLAEVNRTIPLNFFHARVPEDQMLSFRRQALGNLLERELRYQDGVARGLVATPEEMEATFTDALSKLGPQWQSLSAGDRRREFARNRAKIVRRVVLDKVEALELSKVEAVTEADVTAWYAEHADEYRTPDAAHFRHLLLRVDPAASGIEAKALYEKCESIAAHIQETGDFEAAAKEYSDDIYQSVGGDLGFVERGQFLHGVVDETAFALEPGAVSGVISTLYGYHLIQCLEKRPGQPRPFEEVAEQVAVELRERRKQEVLDAWALRLKEQFEVKILAPWADTATRECASGDPASK